MRFLVGTTWIISPTRLQWAPTLTAHDPASVITLESAPPPSVGEGLEGLCRIEQGEKPIPAAGLGGVLQE